MTKSEVYAQLEGQILAVLEDETNLQARMATVACLLRDAFPERFFWTGFYCVDPLRPQELVVGPYQGTLGCLRIPFGRGVCGTAAQQRETQIVDDVHAVENHITCDPRSQSEIVVPVFGADKKLLAVLDIDSEEKAAFDTMDKLALERLTARVFGTSDGN